MKPDLPRRWREGDTIGARDLNKLLDAIERCIINPGQSSGLDISQSQGGTSLRVRPPTNRYLGVTSGTITARSGTTPGTGTVTLYLYSTSAGTVGTSGVNVTVYNFSSTTGGIATSTYVWVEQDVDGNWWITSVDCGN